MNLYEDNMTPIEEEVDEIPVEKAKKKGPFIQIPVIISICIVVLSILAYLGYSMFLLREPEDVLWSVDQEGATYYFEFNKDQTFTAYVGSVELHSEYKKAKNNDINYLMMYYYIGGFEADRYATYDITGSRILGNQEFNVSYDDGTTFSMKQTKERKEYLELPQDFEADEALVGEWVSTPESTGYPADYPAMSLKFGNDGTMVMNDNVSNITYNGIYTIEDGKINFTFYFDDYVVYPSEYKVDGDVLSYFNVEFSRVGSAATQDEK